MVICGYEYMYRINYSNFNDKFLVFSGFNLMKLKWVYDRFDFVLIRVNIFLYLKNDLFFFSNCMSIY